MSDSMYRADRPLGWQPVSRFSPPPATPWRQWLNDRGSLTRRLQRLADGDFSVRVLEEGWLCPDVLSLRSCFPDYQLRQRMWSRRVLLLGSDGEPWVAAHSLIPQSSFTGVVRSIKGIRSKPLGALLFRHRRLQRERFEVVRLPSHWGRRSLFSLDQQPMLVAEFFLPALIARAGKHPQKSGIVLSDGHTGQRGNNE